MMSLLEAISPTARLLLQNEKHINTSTKTNMSLNMKKEIRAELRMLNKDKAKVQRDWSRRQKEIRRSFAMADKIHERAIKDINQADAAYEKGTAKELARISRRISILEGRLA